MTTSPEILIVAGEASGDRLAARLLEGVLRALPNATVWGIGGAHVAALGAELVASASSVNVSGFLEVARHYPRLRKIFRSIVARARRFKPSIAILVDYPGFNLRLAQRLHRLGVHVIYYVAPQVWAWKEGRVRILRESVDDLIVIFPFEVAWFQERGVRAHFFGNPLAEDADARAKARDAGAAAGERDPREVVAYFPGSRQQEIRNHLPVMIDVMRLLGPGYRHVVVRAETVNPSSLILGADDPVYEIAGISSHPLDSARAAVVKAGTSTLDAALARVPFVTVYRTSWLSYTISRLLIHISFVAMPNLLAGRQIVPEFLQGKFRAEPVADELRVLMSDGPRRAGMIASLEAIDTELRGEGAVQRAAQFVVGRVVAA